MKHTYGIFDVDTRQARNSGGWSYMPRTLPYQDDIERLLNASRRHRIPTISTTCVRGNMLDEPEFTALHPDTLFVPMSTEDNAWLSRVGDVDAFFVEKKPRRPGLENNIPHNSWEIFLNNPNANRLIAELDVAEWIVFGNAMDICGDLVVANFLTQNRTVHYIPELMIPGSRCVDCDPELFKQHVYDRWHAQDVRPMTLATVLERFQAATVTV
ncbi:MAG: hypothetical protein ACK5LN_07430 [Propioniciclava sp.]